MTATITGTVDTRTEDATPGCGCCIPPPDATADKGLALLQARREAVERRLQGLGRR